MIDVSKFAETLKGRPVAVFGLGLSNRAVLKAFEAAGIESVTADDGDPQTARALLTSDLSRFACLVLSPGVKPSHPLVRKARWDSIEIICDMEILHSCAHGRKTIGITGTNGKSTTTALIGHILNECGIPAAVGGNIGKAVLDLDMPPAGGAFALEMSSYQIDLCPTFAPDIAVLLNITPDHIDHHGSMENYVAAKKKIFRGPGSAVIATEDEYCRRIAQGIEIERKVYAASAQDAGLPSCDALLGVHNRQNVAAARIVGRLMGLTDAAIAAAVKTFPGLPHRQQFVREIGGLRWVNDSKATNAHAAGMALACYDDIYWILGGKPKEGGLAGLEEYMSRIRCAFLIGAAQEEFAAWLQKNDVPHELCGTMEAAVAAARKEAKSGTVLLSPACASFDQFRNFEHRGETFMTLVNELKGAAA
ncbi:MAG: UDP-N-acetylmuramoyl-L-alanine--D-glutamate ligase [Proteobacteria bacterium]|nr:UDP-N-acetylmuramoyl-L-alanine--D-glutamate ligase [Pseudomonadota bacterium]